MRALVSLITGLGDAALLLPASTVLLVCLARSRSWRTATAWAGTLTLCVALTIAAKMIFYACGGDFPTLAIHSPSGHTSLSATFYGCAALMLSTGQTRSRQLGVFLVTAGVVAAIAASRVVLRAHTVEEVAGGLAIGLLCVTIYAAYYLPRAFFLPDWRALLGAMVVLAALTHGRHLNVEGFFDRMAEHLRVAQYICPLREDVAARPRDEASASARPAGDGGQLRPSLPPVKRDHQS